MTLKGHLAGRQAARQGRTAPRIQSFEEECGKDSVDAVGGSAGVQQADHVMGMRMGIVYLMNYLMILMRMCVYKLI